MCTSAKYQHSFAQDLMTERMGVYYYKTTLIGRISMYVSKNVTLLPMNCSGIIRQACSPPRKENSSKPQWREK